MIPSLPVIAALNCEGTEDDPLDCPYSTEPDCGVEDAIGVHCLPTCEDGDIRLVNGRTEREGRIQICQAGLWGTVCDESWSTRDAEVVCRQLGYITKGIQLSHALY